MSQPPEEQPPQEQVTEKEKSWRTLVPDTLQGFWSRVSAGPQKCRAKKDQATKDKEKKSVGKEIGIIYGSYLILNTIIGPGIFTSPKGVLAGAGSVGMSLVIWGICGVFSTMAALCFAELRESVKRDGVEYAYITEAFGPLAGFVYCWMRIAAAEPVGTAVFAVALADYTADTIYDDCAPPQLLRKSIAILAVVSLALLNVFSQKLSDRMQILATLGKTVALVVIVYFGLKNLVQGETEELTKGFADTQTSATSVTFAFYNGLWAYGGWSNVNHVTSGLKKPPRNVPRLVKTVIPLVMVIYGLVVTSYFTVMTREEMLASEAIGVTWAQRTFDGGLVAIIPIGVGLTALGSLNATFLSAGRLSGVAVKDGNIPEVTSWVHVRSKTPILTVYTRLLIATIMILVAESGELVRFFIFSVWLFHGMSILALLVLRYKNKDKVRPYKVNLVLPVIVVGVIAFLLIGPFLETPKPEFISSLVLIALSLICYLPSRWLQDRANMPDKFIVWLQLFFRIAPKRDLRRKSFLRRMSSLALARNSILIPAGASPATIRRIQESPNLLRRVSRASNLLLHDIAASPSLYRRASPGIIRRVERHRSLAEADLKRGRSNSHVVFLETGHGEGSPALVRRRPSRQVASFGSADKDPQTLPHLKSMPNMKVISKDMEKGNGSDPNHNFHHGNSNFPYKVSFSLGAATSSLNSSPNSSPIIHTGNLGPGVRDGRGRGQANDGGRGKLVSGTRHMSISNSLALPPLNYHIPPAPPLPNNIPHHTLDSPIFEESYVSSTSSPSPLLSHSSRRNSASSDHEAGANNDLSAPAAPAFKRPKDGDSASAIRQRAGSYAASAFKRFSAGLEEGRSGKASKYTDTESLARERASSDVTSAARYSDTSSLRHRAIDGASSRRHSLSVSLSADMQRYNQDRDAASARRMSLNDLDLDILGEYESDGGGEYELLALPTLLDLERAARGHSSFSSGSSSSSDSDDDWRLGSLFDSTDSTDSDSSSSSTTLQEDGSVSTRRNSYSSQDFSDDDVVFALDHDRNFDSIV